MRGRSMKHVLAKVCFLASLVCSSYAFGDVNPFVVGGTKAKKGEFPFIVSLHDKQGHLCGGSLIKKNWVLTAGHCVADGLKISKVYVGLMDQKKLKDAEMLTVKKVI